MCLMWFNQWLASEAGANNNSVARYFGMLALLLIAISAGQIIAYIYLNNNVFASYECG